MLRIALGVIAGFIGWILVWFGSETILSVLWPAFGKHQAAFQEAIELGPRASGFIPDPTFLIVHIVLALIVSLLAGSLCALVAGENKKSPLVLGSLLLALGVLKAFMTWPLVPAWYHVIFAALLLSMTLLGGKMKRASQ